MIRLDLRDRFGVANIDPALRCDHVVPRLVRHVADAAGEAAITVAVDLALQNPAGSRYDFWLATDAKVAQKIRGLIADIQRDHFRGMGKPEPLRHALKGYWSRRITGEHRLVYRVEGKPPVLTIAQCRDHY